MEQAQIIKVAIAVIITVVLNQVISVFTIKSDNDLINDVESLQEKLIQYQNKIDSIEISDNFGDSIRDQKLKVLDERDAKLVHELDSIVRNNNQTRDAIRSIEKDLNNSGINISDLPDL